MINQKNKTGIALLIAIPVITHVILLSKYAVNFPFKDDYRVFVSYLYHFLNSPDRLKMIFLPDNESHPVLMRLITLVQYKLDGYLDFKHILLFCNLFLVLFATSLALHFYRMREYWNIAMMCLLVFNAVHHEMYFRTDVGTYQLLSFSFSIFLFYGVSYYSSLSLLVRIFFYLAFIITPFGSINGMLANVLVVIFFAVNRNNKKALLATALLLVVQLSVIMYVSSGAKSFNVFESISRYNVQLIYAYFLSLGGMFSIISNPTTWTIIAIITFGIFGYTGYRLFFPFRFELNFEKLVFIFCSVSLALIVVLRYNYWLSGYISVLESRYKIYGALVVLLFFAVLDRKYASIKWFRPIQAGFLLVLFFAGLYKGTSMLKMQKLEQITEAYNVHTGSYQEPYALSFYIDSVKHTYLKKEKIFSFERAEEFTKNTLIEDNRLTGITASVLRESADPNSTGDWVGMPVKMYEFQVEGNFPRRKYYFVKFNGTDGRSALQYLTPPPVSLLQKSSSAPVMVLQKAFYFAFEGVDFTDFEIYGVDDLGV